MEKKHTICMPCISKVTMVSENIMMLMVQEGEIIGGVQVPYQAEPGETLETDVNIPALVYIVKNGNRIGVKVEDKQLGTQRFPYEHVVGEKLDTGKADDADNYTLDGTHPVRVYRKTKPNNMADPYQGYTFLHCIYLVFSDSVTDKKSAELKIAHGIFSQERIHVNLDAAEAMSEAVHVNQLGYRPDDPSKKAYLSMWMGLGGGISYDNIHEFYIEDSKGANVYSGNVKFLHSGKVVPMGHEEISSLCPIYEMDFSDFCKEGSFRIVVPGLGCSYEFPIDEKITWENGFRKSMNALYCQRSGIVTCRPCSDFTRPRCYHPDDGKVIYQSTCTLFESNNGMNCYGTDTNNFGNLLRGASDEIVENAWGGYFDACDWDRRVQHLRASDLHMELFLMFPEYFTELKLPIPESGNGIPDILNEAMYNVDIYRRLQMPDGGIRGGIEQEEHPILGQCGWQDTWKSYAYAPDFWSSYYYASSAARMSFALHKSKPELAKTYLASAEAAFDYAERTYKEKLKAEGHKWTQRAHKDTRLRRELAACDLFRATLKPEYEETYLQIREDSSYEADFIYCTLPKGIGQEPVKRACRQAIIDAADCAVKNGAELPYHLTSENIPGEQAGGYRSFCTIPRNTELIRAHYLSGNPEYLKAAIAASDFACGDNQENLCYTTGLGSNAVKNILHHDSRMTGQNPPAGITVFGPHDFNHHPDDSFANLMKDDFMWPGAYAWPSFEGYLDIYRYPNVTEYTVQSSIGPNAYQWGYFAARHGL